MIKRNACVSKTRSSLIAIALLGSGLALPAMAQDADDASVEDDGQDTVETVDPENRILITAQGRQQELSDVPVAVSAITAAELERSGATNLLHVVTLSGDELEGYEA